MLGRSPTKQQGWRAPFSAISLLVIFGLLLGGQPAWADPEGGTASLQKALSEASKGYTDAQAKLEASRKRQGELSQQIDAATAHQHKLETTVAAIARQAYQTGPTLRLAVVMDSSSLDTTVERMTILDHLSWQNGQQLVALKNTRRTLSNDKKKLDNEVSQEDAQEKEMAKRKADALAALEKAGGGSAAGGYSSGAPGAEPAPRNPDGSWPSESCSVKDPTTSGCITPRTNHALQQARAAGFNHYTACFRQESSGEHPKGRACDFSASANGFAGAATGDERAYGNRLAGWFVENADRLAVLYVIWYRQIWLPGTGWRAYSGSGSPSQEHTNHVHLSEQ